MHPGACAISEAMFVRVTRPTTCSTGPSTSKRTSWPRRRAQAGSAAKLALAKFPSLAGCIGSDQDQGSPQQGPALGGGQSTARAQLPSSTSTALACAMPIPTWGSTTWLPAWSKSPGGGTPVERAVAREH